MPDAPGPDEGDQSRFDHPAPGSRRQRPGPIERGGTTAGTGNRVGFATRLCHFTSRGDPCPNPARCSYAHFMEELRARPGVGKPHTRGRASGRCRACQGVIDGYRPHVCPQDNNALLTGGGAAPPGFVTQRCPYCDALVPVPHPTALLKICLCGCEPYLLAVYSRDILPMQLSRGLITKM